MPGRPGPLYLRALFRALDAGLPERLQQLLAPPARSLPQTLLPLSRRSYRPGRLAPGPRGPGRRAGEDPEAARRDGDRVPDRSGDGDPGRRHPPRRLGRGRVDRPPEHRAHRGGGRDRRQEGRPHHRRGRPPADQRAEAGAALQRAPGADPRTPARAGDPARPGGAGGVLGPALFPPPSDAPRDRGADDRRPSDPHRRAGPVREPPGWRRARVAATWIDHHLGSDFVQGSPRRGEGRPTGGHPARGQGAAPARQAPPGRRRIGPPGPLPSDPRGGPRLLPGGRDDLPAGRATGDRGGAPVPCRQRSVLGRPGRRRPGAGGLRVTHPTGSREGRAGGAAGARARGGDGVAGPDRDDAAGGDGEEGGWKPRDPRSRRRHPAAGDRGAPQGGRWAPADGLRREEGGGRAGGRGTETPRRREEARQGQRRAPTGSSRRSAGRVSKTGTRASAPATGWQPRSTRSRGASGRARRRSRPWSWS